MHAYWPSQFQKWIRNIWTKTVNWRWWELWIWQPWLTVMFYAIYRVLMSISMWVEWLWMQTTGWYSSLPFFSSWRVVIVGWVDLQCVDFQFCIYTCSFSKNWKTRLCVFGNMYCGATLQSHKFALYTNSHCHCRVVNYKTLVLTWCRYVANLYATSVRSPDSQNSHAASSLVG